MRIEQRVSRAWARMTEPESGCRLCPWECGVNRLAGSRGRCWMQDPASSGQYCPDFTRASPFGE
ncbi:MAG: hypothetical protein ACOX5Z_00560 [Desulfobulbus sp.]|jgi:uncharacterized Fe-S radical SAM superfamily protein PflX